jgi:predicted permease
LLTETGVGFLFLLGRINPGMTIDAARDEVSGLLALGAGTLFRTGMEAVLTPLDEHIFGTTRPALILLAACVGLVLLIGCANVAVLLLARLATRAHDTAVRLAIGASRWRIVRRSLADALLLAVLGEAAGFGLAYWTVDMLVALAPPDVPRLDGVRFDARTFAFAWATCLVTTVLVGLGPGLHASRWTFTNALSHGSSRVTRSQRVRRVFVVAQVGLALVLLVCAGLVGRSFVNLLRLDIGFEPANVLTLDVTVPDAPADRHNRFYTALLARVGAMPGVDAAGAVFLRPLEHAGIGSDVPLLIEGQSTDLAFRHWERNPISNLESVTPDYFHAIGIRLLRGRMFVDTDTVGTPRVAIVSDDLAQRLWPGQDPIGRRIYAPGVVERADAPLQQRWPTVVGVVGDARYRGLSDPRVDLYVPYLQHPNLLVKHLMVRTDRDPLAFVDVIRREARQLEPTAIVENVATMEQIVGRAMAPWRFSALTLALVGGVALVLAASGVGAVVSQFVIERTREIGVRVAVGAGPRHIAGLFLRDGLRLTAIGVAIGVTVAVGAAQVLTSLLYDVPPHDPLTLAGMAALFMVVSTAATLFPVWRATHINPLNALRAE